MTSDDAPFQVATAPRPIARTLMLVALLAFAAGAAALAAMIHYGGLRVGRAPDPRPADPVVVQPAPRPAPMASLRALSAREATIAGRIGEIEARLATIDADARAAGTMAARAESMMVVFATRRALDRGTDLGYLRNQLRARFGATEPQAVTTVIAAADDPVTLEDLRTALDTIAPMLSAGDPDESWWTGIRRELSQLVVIRQEATPSPLPADRLQRARRRLDAGQVEAASAEIARMPGAARAANWMYAARSYVATRRALIALERSAIESAPMIAPAAPSPEPVDATPDAAASLQ